MGLGMGTDKPIIDIFFIVCAVIFYFVYRYIIFGCYREFHHYRELKKIKDNKNKFHRLTGLYLLSVNKGQSIFIRTALILTIFQILFVLLFLVIYLLNIFGIVFIRENEIIRKAYLFLLSIHLCLILIHYLIKIRFKK
jgi:hypothetical protein